MTKKLLKSMGDDSIVYATSLSNQMIKRFVNLNTEIESCENLK